MITAIFENGQSVARQSEKTFSVHQVSPTGFQVVEDKSNAIIAKFSDFDTSTNQAMADEEAKDISDEVGRGIVEIVHGRVEIKTPEWVYDKNTQMQQALREAGYTFWQTLGDVNKFGWAKSDVTEWNEWITKFNSAYQATSYAYRMVIELGRTI